MRRHFVGFVEHFSRNLMKRRVFFDESFFPQILNNRTSKYQDGQDVMDLCCFVKNLTFYKHCKYLQRPRKILINHELFRKYDLRQFQASNISCKMSCKSILKLAIFSCYEPLSRCIFLQHRLYFHPFHCRHLVNYQSTHHSTCLQRDHGVEKKITLIIKFSCNQVSHFLVGKLISRKISNVYTLEITLTLFCQKIRESNVFTKD